MLPCSGTAIPAVGRRSLHSEERGLLLGPLAEGEATRRLLRLRPGHLLRGRRAGRAAGQHGQAEAQRDGPAPGRDEGLLQPGEPQRRPLHGLAGPGAEPAGGEPAGRVGGEPQMGGLRNRSHHVWIV